ncbi:TldD/PmbA family protein [Candidatus Woesearchaeota archaeon]|nr:TldD/PmbA family protein [Candidatus Woesearchaeota archaeon]
MHSDKKEFLASLIPLLEKKGCYAEALYIRDDSLGVNRDNTSVDVGKQRDEGVKLRVYDGERWHEKGVSGWDEKALTKAAKVLGKVKKQKKNVKLDIREDPINADYKALGKIDPTTIPLDEKITTVKKLHEQFLGTSKKLVNARVYYSEMRETKVFVNRHRKLSQVISGCHFVLIAFVQSPDGDLRYHYKSLFDHGWERSKIPKKILNEVAKFAERVAQAEKLKPGKYTCLLTPAMSGLLAHESFGHGMEADTIFKDRAKAADYFGKRLASEKVSIADGPLMLGTHGFFFFDDEGFRATKTYMIKKGIVTHPITDAYNAARVKKPRSSNGRCESFDRKIFARMTTTYFEPGKSSKDAMLKRIKDGLILHESSGGMEDPKGWGIQIQGVIAEEVKKGKPTGKLFYEAGMTGYLPDVLKNIKAVSKEFDIPGTGRCGKGHHDWVRVAEGGPYLLIDEVVLS